MLDFISKLKPQRNDDEQKDNYVASIVHDLKNPLISQERILENCIRSTTNSSLKEQYNQLLLSTRIMLEMVLSIINTYRYNHGSIKCDFKPINIIALIHEVCKELTFLTDEKTFIRIKTPLAKLFIEADKLHIRRVISNLLANSIRYRRENTNILIELAEDNKNFTFKITNYGHYIKPNLQKELFKKYVSNSSKFNSIGTGLGLYLSKQIINAHNGKMFIISTKEGLNTFGFIMPKCSNKKAKIEKDVIFADLL